MSTSSLLNTLNEVTAAPASLESDAAEVHGLKSLEETSPPKSEWPPNGHNMRIVSIDAESRVVPNDMNPPTRLQVRLIYVRAKWRLHWYRHHLRSPPRPGSR
ncbi:hypothetical protein D6D17_08965 [Aureobasidium pullulans]|nr:hypothetical protein D6D17_08965 [Aureobasidium pullulans]